MKSKTAYRYLQKRILRTEKRAIEKTTPHRYRQADTKSHDLVEKR